jgi:D-alanyl-D-alanine carboxypeptidase
VKPFVAATVLQLAEAGAFTLDESLPAVLPVDVTSRFQGASEITVRMLLGHRSGLPDWDSSDVDVAIVGDLGKIWTDSDLLDLAAAKEPLFSPGADYSYSNTNYTLLGLIIEHATGADWRDEVTNGVIKPLELEATALPAPGDRSLGGPHAHGYVDVNGELLDVSTADPSMFGAAGGNALVTSVSDLVRFMNALLAGRLFQHSETLNAMLDFKPATEEPGQIGYGLGLLQRALPGGIETIDHLGGAIGYRAYVARLPRQQVTLATAMNSLADPSLLVLPVVGAFASPEG